MKKLTQLITESLVKDEYIEDCLIHFEDMGFYKYTYIFLNGNTPFFPKNWIFF